LSKVLLSSLLLDSIHTQNQKLGANGFQDDVLADDVELVALTLFLVEVVFSLFVLGVFTTGLTVVLGVLILRGVLTRGVLLNELDLKLELLNPPP